VCVRSLATVASCMTSQRKAPEPPCVETHSTMAAKQGLTAQISQASEDARRSILEKTGAHTWFSNLNTTCTIKSAPPRSPEVLSLLATKTGWLYKRNEQHHWQVRWCCIVPHTFLYYCKFMRTQSRCTRREVTTAISPEISEYPVARPFHVHSTLFSPFLTTYD